MGRGGDVPMLAKILRKELICVEDNCKKNSYMTCFVIQSISKLKGAPSFMATVLRSPLSCAFETHNRHNRAQKAHKKLFAKQPLPLSAPIFESTCFAKNSFHACLLFHRPSRTRRGRLPTFSFWSTFLRCAMPCSRLIAISFSLVSQPTTQH